MRSKGLLVFMATFLVTACGSETNRAAVTQAVQSGESGSSYTYCDCVLNPPTTDAKAKACGDIIEAMGFEQAAVEALECKKQIPVPSGGPDACYCLLAVSEDPDIMQACENLFDDISEADMLTLTRSCDAKMVQ